MKRLDLISDILSKIDEIKLIELTGEALGMNFPKLKIDTYNTLEEFHQYLWSYNKNQEYEAIRKTNADVDFKCYSSMTTQLTNSLLEVFSTIINNKETKYPLEVYDLNNFIIYAQSEEDRDYLRQSLSMLMAN